MHASLPPTIDREHDVEASSGSVDSEVKPQSTGAAEGAPRKSCCCIDNVVWEMKVYWDQIQ
uniref:Uncharacterized protein n=1 Tax=Pristionchus pacificus TaxID=54126 RepID=A0A2A6B7F5_PRIPA|eukprot:PDM61797.1 hypothetical protein PRIPAC_51239 [Pristionchus pacificus]